MRGRDNKAGSVFEGPIPMQTAAALKGKRGKKILASHGHNQGTEIKNITEDKSQVLHGIGGPA